MFFCSTIEGGTPLFLSLCVGFTGYSGGVIYRVYFVGCPGCLTGIFRLNLPIGGRPCTGLAGDCGFSASKLSRLPGFVLDGVSQGLFSVSL